MNDQFSFGAIIKCLNVSFTVLVEINFVLKDRYLLHSLICEGEYSYEKVE